MLQVLHPLFTGNLMSVSKAGYEGVMQHDELRTPYRQMYGLSVSLEVCGSEALSYDPFPSGHILPRNLIRR